jgi:hypothetical protein
LLLSFPQKAALEATDIGLQKVPKRGRYLRPVMMRFSGVC